MAPSTRTRAGKRARSEAVSSASSTSSRSCSRSTSPASYANRFEPRVTRAKMKAMEQNRRKTRRLVKLEQELLRDEQQEKEANEAIEGIVEDLIDAKHIVVVVGAGISRASGLPDFRSKKGIYKMIKELDLDVPEPESLFDLEYFKEDPEPFYKFAHRLWPSSENQTRPSKTHYFLKVLDQLNRIGRIYTQNIDGLEEEAGIRKTKIVPCHGTLSKLQCMDCKRNYSKEDVEDAVMGQTVPTCSRSKCKGILKPSITFFGEKVDLRVGKTMEADVCKADVVLVIGTTLQVAPVSNIPGWIDEDIPIYLINNQPVREGVIFDAELIGDCDVVCSHLYCKMSEIINTRNTGFYKPVKSTYVIKCTENLFKFYDENNFKRGHDT